MAEPTQSGARPEIGTVLGRRYTLSRFLGAGGVGAVYEAVTPDGERVAVKLVLASSLAQAGEEIGRRFEREARLGSTLDSPYIVPVLDAARDVELDLPFLVMPLLVGLDLNELLKRAGVLHPAVAVRIIRQACLALGAAHAAGVVHRDIKPANLFLDHGRDGRITLRVLDFGIAKWRAQGGELTRTDSLLGTPRYMAPEQIQNPKSVDARADVWSLAAVLYRSLSGVVPFREHREIGQLFVALATSEVPWIQKAAPWLDPALALVVHGALLRDREARCPSARAFADALESFGGGSEDITVEMLEPLSPDKRARKAPVATPPETWQVPGPAARARSTVSLELQASARDPLVGSALGGRFTLLRAMGKGGMGTVYEAADTNGSRVAIKVMDLRHAEGEPARQRFVREARAAMSLRNEHVVQVLEAGTDADTGRAYIVMERLVGVDLGAAVGQLGPLDPTVVARLFVQACHGIGAAHELGLVHRDIKPANLFLHELPSGDVTVKICDFGIVKVVRVEDGDETATQLTRTGGVVGSPAYMSPEQSMSARDIDHRADIWSLGVSLYYALTGLHPWHGRESVGELIVAICTEPLPHIQNKAPWIAPGLAEVVHRSVTRRREARFQSMADFSAALIPFTDGRTAVRAQDIAPLASQLQGKVALRVALPTESSTRTDEGSATEALRPARRRGSTAAAVAGVTAVVLGGAIGIWVMRPAAKVDAPSASAEHAEGASAPPGAPASAPAADVRALVHVAPSTASVTVNGEQRELHDGAVVLVGQPGDRFTLVVSDRRHSRSTVVLLGKDGVPSVDTIDLESSTGPGASGRAEAPATPSTAAPTGRAAATHTAVATTAAPAATGTGRAPPKAKDAW